MKNKIRTLPVPLQDLLIYRVALAILALGTSLALAIFLHDVHFALPGLILCVTMLISAVLLYRLLMQGRYLALRGTVLHVEQTMIRKHTKVIILEAEGKALRHPAKKPAHEGGPGRCVGSISGRHYQTVPMAWDVSAQRIFGPFYT